uniref:PGG domain-containing protein n=1 Tax=Zea mays TaxID=4577 RepID=A0A804UIX9_MAIZE
MASNNNNNKVASSHSPMASGGTQSHTQSQPGAGAGAGDGAKPSSSSMEYQLRQYLLLLASLVATVTYGAGLNLPGGAWQVNDGQHHAGDSILQDAHRHRYLIFYYCNATAFAASLVVSVLLLVLDGKNTGWWEALLRVVMVLDLLGLMGAYAAGSCRDKFTTIYSALLVCAVFAYVVAAFCWYLGVLALPRKKHRDDHNTAKNNDTSAANVHGYEREELDEVLMLLATFAVTITYVAGLNPPGGFWGDTKDGHQMSDPVLQENYSRRYWAFYVCNTTAFVASLLIIILVVDKKLTAKLSVRFVAHGAPGPHGGLRRWELQGGPRKHLRHLPERRSSCLHLPPGGRRRHSEESLQMLTNCIRLCFEMSARSKGLVL